MLCGVGRKENQKVFMLIPDQSDDESIKKVVIVLMI